MRTVIVSNRLPVTIERTGEGPCTRPSTGGLATGLRGVHVEGESWWIGWPGDVGASETVRGAVTDMLRTHRMEAVWLERAELDGYYARIANGAIWPLFHYLTEQLPLVITGWDAYEQVNARFADAVVRQYQPGDRIWVHDYQLMLVPDMVRAKLPDARIGFFLHIPFPASEVFRTLPFREHLLRGLLGADLIGFHTAAYARHFLSSLLRLLGLAARVDRVQVGDREVTIGVFPMGIAAKEWETLAGAPAVEEAIERLRGADGCRQLVGIDRLDYTKGIPRRILAFERLLETHPELHERVRLIQLAVPSRTGVAAYREYRKNIEGLVGKVNGRFGTTRWAPVHYLHRAIEQHEIVALYRMADVMVVTPLRDGMNLVAKEFVAARTDEGGVLVLSELTGAASELAEALQVNPYDVDRTAETLHRALTLPDEERQERMRALRRRVLSFDVDRWAETFLRALNDASERSHPASVAMTQPKDLAHLIAKLQAASALVLLLDYDGTLVPFAGVPELAIPDPPLRDLLERLAQRPNTTVHMVSGRLRSTLERWFGSLPLWLHAEHGYWTRSPGRDWQASPTPPLDWRERAGAILEEFRARTPGSLIEQKTAALTWHYRMADPEFGPHQANELRLHLAELLSNEPVEILPGDKVIELRPHGMHKGRVVDAAVRAAPNGALLLAMGDDRTDEDLFAALPPEGVAVHVGPSTSRAPVRLVDWQAARALLARLTDGSAGN